MPGMTLNPRQTALLEEVRTQGFASIDELARKFGVTLQTVRRDVNLHKLLVMVPTLLLS